MKTRRRDIQAVLAAAACSAVFGACGDDTASEQLADQQTLEQERRDAAKSARQGERLRQLENDLSQQDDEGASTVAEPESPSATPAGPSASVSGGTRDSWPVGVSGWTVVLTSARTRSEAEAVADRAVAAGLPQAGVLNSTNYSTLNRGYWVAYTGVLERDEAQSRQVDARASGFGSAYVREIAP